MGSVKDHRLIVKWSKRERDHVADLSPRITNASLHYILMSVLTKEVMAELKSRGFDPETLKFSIDRSPEGITEIEKARQSNG